jgi:hypothetical protein
MIEIAMATDLTLEGERGTVLVAADPTRHIVQLVNCTNVTVRRLEMDRHPLVFTQGKITSVDIAAKTVEVSIDPGYDEPDAQYLARLKSFLVSSFSQKRPQVCKCLAGCPGCPGRPGGVRGCPGLQNLGGHQSTNLRRF